MYGEPKDIDGECNARLFIGDNFGDAHATMRCRLPDGHTGPHKESFRRRSNNQVEVTWAVDESIEECAQCGKTFRNIAQETCVCSEECLEKWLIDIDEAGS